MRHALPFVSRRARHPRRYEHELLSMVLERIDLAIVACDLAARVTHASHGARMMMGSAVAIGSGPEDWIEQLRPRTPEGLPLAVEDLALVRVLAGRSVPRFDVLVKAGRGERLLHVSALPLSGAGARGLLGAVAIFEASS